MLQIKCYVVKKVIVIFVGVAFSLDTSISVLFQMSVNR